MLVPTLIEVDGTGVTLEPGVTAAENRKMKVWIDCMKKLTYTKTLLMISISKTSYICAYLVLKRLKLKLLKNFLKYLSVNQNNTELQGKSEINLIYQ